jgi:hypothetical protein
LVEAQDWINFILCPSAAVKLSKLPSYYIYYIPAKIPYKNKCSNFQRTLFAHIPWDDRTNPGQSDIVTVLKTMKSYEKDIGIVMKYDRTIAHFCMRNGDIHAMPREISTKG